MMKNNLTTIYLVRHGESEGNAMVASDHIAGKGSNLTQKGKEQEDALGKKLAQVHFAAAFSSDLARAEQTAEIITLERDLAVKTTERIREWSLAEYFKTHPGQSRETVEQDLIQALQTLDDKAKLAYKHTEEFESANESVARLLTFLREIAVAYSGKNVLVVAHGNLMRSMLTHLGWATYDELAKNAIENTGYCVLESDGVDFFIKETVGITKYPEGKRGW